MDCERLEIPLWNGVWSGEIYEFEYYQISVHFKFGVNEVLTHFSNGIITFPKAVFLMVFIQSLYKWEGKQDY